MNNQHDLTKRTPVENGSKATDQTMAGDDANQVDTAQQFGDRIDLIFPDLWQTQRTLQVRDLVEKVGRNVACAFLSDSIGAEVSCDSSARMFRWGKSDEVRYQPKDVSYEMSNTYPLHYDESGHLIPLLHWYNSTELTLVCGIDLSHGYRSDFAFVRASVLRDVGFSRPVEDIYLTADYQEATHLLIRSFWGGPHSTTRGMPVSQKKHLMDTKRLEFYHGPQSNNGKEGVDYFCVPIDPDAAEYEQLRNAMRNAVLSDAAAQMAAEEEFWKRYLQVLKLHNDQSLAKDTCDKLRAQVEAAIKRCRQWTHNALTPLLHAPTADDIPTMEPLKDDEEYYVCSSEELEQLVRQRERRVNELATYGIKFETVTENWLKYANHFCRLNRHLTDGWVEVFGEAAVVTFPKQNSVAISALHAAMPGKMDYEQTVFPLSAGALAEAATLIHEHQETVKTNQCAAQMSVEALEALCAKDEN